MDASEPYDHVIVGAGLSGLLLAETLRRLPGEHRPPGAEHISAHQGDHGPRVLLVESDPEPGPPKTLAFWSRHPGPLDRWALRSWDRVTIAASDGGTTSVELGAYRYTAVDWRAARKELLARMRADSRVTVMPGQVSAVRDTVAGAEVRVAGRWLAGRWVYDSRPHQPELATGGRWPDHDSAVPRGTGAVTTEADAGRRGRWPRPAPLLLHQAFRGVWVELDDARLDPATATLMDFRAVDGPELGFSYALPVSERSALVMAVRMGAAGELPDPGPALVGTIGPRGWRTVAEEQGITELRSAPRGRREGRHVLAIGARGGRVRPSTGYALTRIAADSRAIGASLRAHGHPFAIPGDPRRDRVLDAIWLHALAEQGAGMADAFVTVFQEVPADAVLRFLDGRARPADLARVVAVLPKGPFLAAAARWARGHPGVLE